MATPYLQRRAGETTSTQDLARAELGTVPLLVMAHTQTGGRGRSGSSWENADRALAVSLAFHAHPGDRRPHSLMAGVAVCRVVGNANLKWPNDVMIGGDKVGGILVERSGDTIVVGLGLNLYWRTPPAGATSVLGSDPGPDHYLAVGALWGAEMMKLIDSPGWPLDEYRDRSATIWKDLTWEPGGYGRAVNVAEDGALVVETPDGLERIYSGEVRHIRG